MDYSHLSEILCLVQGNNMMQKDRGGNNRQRAEHMENAIQGQSSSDSVLRHYLDY